MIQILFINYFRENKISEEGAKSIASGFEYLNNLVKFKLNVG
jgi:hypothetical protein